MLPLSHQTWSQSDPGTFALVPWCVSQPLLPCRKLFRRGALWLWGHAPSWASSGGLPQEQSRTFPLPQKIADYFIVRLELNLPPPATGFERLNRTPAHPPQTRYLGLFRTRVLWGFLNNFSYKLSAAVSAVFSLPKHLPETWITVKVSEKTGSLLCAPALQAQKPAWTGGTLLFTEMDNTAAWQRGNEHQICSRLMNTAVCSQLPLQEQGFPQHPGLNKCQRPYASSCNTTTAVPPQYFRIKASATFVSRVWKLSSHMLILTVPKRSRKLLAVWGLAPLFSDLNKYNGAIMRPVHTGENNLLANKA